jgi:Fe2+ transport system protein FeoA
MSTKAADGQPEQAFGPSGHSEGGHTKLSSRQTLADVRKGQRVTISAVDATSTEVQRLMTLGLVEGAEIELAGRAIGGDPLEFRLFGRGVSLRKEQARCFSYETAGASD